MLNNALRLLPIIILLPIPLLAQTYPKIEAYGGYQNLWEPSRPYDGFRVEAAVNVNRRFAFVGEFGYGNYSEAEEGYRYLDKGRTYLTGPRFTFSISRVRIISQILLGANHQTRRQYGSGYSYLDEDYIDQTTSSTSFAVSAGAGIELPINDRISARVAQIDWLGTRVSEIMGSSFRQGTWIYLYHDYWEDKMRFSAGVVFKFGKAGKTH